MNSVQKRRLIKNYFKKLPMNSIYLIVGAALGVFFVPQFAIVALAAAGFGGWRLYNYFKKPSDQEMDSWLKEDLNLVDQESFQEVMLDKSILVRPSVMLIGSPPLEETGGAELLSIQGKDKVYRFTPVQATIIHFTEHYLVTYQCALDLTTGKKLNDDANRYFYRDIVSANTKKTDITIDTKNLSNSFLNRYPEIKKRIVNGRLQINQAKTFRLTSTAGTYVEVRLSVPGFVEDLGANSLSKKLADNAINSIYAMLDVKKTV